MGGRFLLADGCLPNSCFSFKDSLLNYFSSLFQILELKVISSVYMMVDSRNIYKKGNEQLMMVIGQWPCPEQLSVTLSGNWFLKIPANRYF